MKENNDLLPLYIVILIILCVAVAKKKKEVKEEVTTESQGHFESYTIKDSVCPPFSPIEKKVLKDLDN